MSITRRLALISAAIGLAAVGIALWLAIDPTGPAHAALRYDERTTTRGTERPDAGRTGAIFVESTARAGEPLATALERSFGEALASVYEIDGVERGALARAASAFVAAESVHDVEWRLAAYRRWGMQVPDMSDYRRRLEEFPQRLQPAGFRSWSNEQLLRHEMRDARPWRSVAFESLIARPAARDGQGGARPFPPLTPAPGQRAMPWMFVPPGIPEVRRAAADGAPAVVLSFDLVDHYGRTVHASVAFVRVAEGEWWPFQSRSIGEVGDEGP